jgi:PAS domain-containing protein
MSTKGSGPNSEHASLPIPTGDVDYEAVFDATPGFYLVLDKECNILGVNEAYLHATQTTRDIVGRNLFDVFPENPNDPTEKGEENVRGAVQRVLASGKKDVLPVQKYDITAPDGSFVTRYWSPLHMPIFDKNKNLKCILHRVEDVTALMTANDQVANLDKNLGTLLHFMSFFWRILDIFVLILC